MSAKLPRVKSIGNTHVSSFSRDSKTPTRNPYKPCRYLRVPGVVFANIIQCINPLRGEGFDDDVFNAQRIYTAMKTFSCKTANRRREILIKHIVHLLEVMSVCQMTVECIWEPIRDPTYTLSVFIIVGTVGFHPS